MNCSREMFPLRVCYAWTIWKAQGQTIRGKVVVDIGSREADHGLTYTAFSRCQRFSNIGIQGGFPYNRISTMIRSQKKLKERLKEEQRLNTLSRETIHMLRSL